MTKRMMAGAVIVLLLIGGGTAYFATKNKADKSSQKSSQPENNQSGGSQNSFSPASTEGLEFKATISSSGGGTDSSATFEHDDKGSTRYVANTGGQQIEFIYTSDAYYSCQGGGNCVKYPLSQASGFNPGDYTYDQGKLTGYRNGAAYKGQKSCPSGTCDVWSVSAGGKAASTLYIDSGTKRITQVETAAASVTSKIVYEYTDVTIDIPTNAQTLPTGQ